jgi:heptosyltransferase-2
LNRILVIRGGALGHFLLTLPAIKLLRKAFPTAHLEILGYNHIVRLAELGGYANATRSIEYGPLASFFTRDGDLPAELVEYFAGFQKVVSYLFDPDEIFAHNLQRAGVRNLIAGSPKITEKEHAARQLARPLERLAIYLEEPVAWILPNEPRSPNQNLIAIHPGSGSERKNWPGPGFRELASWFLEQDEKCKLMLIGGEADEERLTMLSAGLPDERLEIRQNRPLTALALELRNCALFVGHDSGISHLAAALGVPSLLLYGPTDPAVWAPRNPAVRILRASNRTMEGIALRDVIASLGEIRR